jgi:hypothetical protein
MKNINTMNKMKIWNKSLTWLILITALVLPWGAQAMKETEKTITKQASVSPSSKILFTNKLGPLQVETWEKNEVKVVTRVTIDGSEEDVNEVLSILDQIDFKSNGLEGIKIVLNNGKKVKGISKLKFEYTLTVPTNIDLHIEQKYEDITLLDLHGNVTLDLYESDMMAGLLSGNTSIGMKYGKAEIGIVGALKLKLYESECSIEQTKDLILNSKYSYLKIKEAGTLRLECYEDKIDVLKHQDVIAKAKYTHLYLRDCTYGKFDCYETNIDAGNFETINIKAKYGHFNFESIKHLNFNESYENKLMVARLGDITANSKYGNYEILQLDKKLDFSESYEDDITIGKVSKDFSGIDLVSKYTNLIMTFETGSLYKINANLKYTSLKFPEAKIREIRYHKEGSDFQYKGISHDADESRVSTLNFDMYEGKVVLN